MLFKHHRRTEPGETLASIVDKISCRVGVHLPFRANYSSFRTCDEGLSLVYVTEKFPLWTPHYGGTWEQEVELFGGDKHVGAYIHHKPHPRTVNYPPPILVDLTCKEENAQWVLEYTFLAGRECRQQIMVNTTWPFARTTPMDLGYSLKEHLKVLT
jgi:hypothetical protein